ncbi:MAG: PAS domain S-box protein [Calditrichaeota bacterium]|nr:MAG: PAS domain S-box protein [Calditrichota bacterium]
MAPEEEKFVTLDGRTLTVEISTMPIEFQGKRSFMSIINDITDRKQVMERYQTLVEQSNDAIYLLYDGKFEFINKRFTEIFGYTLEECNTPEFNFLNLIAPESLESIKQRMEDFARGKKLPDLYEFVALNKQGQRVYCEASVSYVKYKEGHATQGVIRDITRRKEVELEIKKLSQAVEQNPVSIMILDAQGKVEYVNQTFIEKLGYQEDEIIGKKPTFLYEEVVDEEKYQDFYNHIEQRKVWQAEIPIKKKDGTIIFSKTLVSPVFDQHGNVINFLNMSEDITHQKQLEEQFLQSQKMEAIGRLAGGVAHDFNNLLTVINGYSELLLHKLSPENPLFEPIVQIKEAGRRAASLTSQLLAFSRKQIMQPKILDLNLVIKDMAKMLNRLIGEDINLTILYDETLGLIKADPGQIEQVIMNLVVNARDAMPEGGQLTVKLSNTYLDKNYVNVFSDLNEGWYAEIDITDTGVGMSKEVLSHIFEPFFSTKEKGKGTGLGLATVYGIVKQSGGHIRVYSEVGQGTTFKIYFPIVNEEEIAEESETRLRKNLEGNETILVAEDESSVRELILAGLGNYGYKILTAKNLNEAVKLFEENEKEIDFLLTDVVMPGGSGAELANILKKKKEDLKILFMSGYTDDNIVQRGILPEDVNFIQKPFTVQDLAAQIRQIIDHD